MTATLTALSDLLRRAWDATRAIGSGGASGTLPPGVGAREAAAAVALGTWGAKAMQLPELVNLGAWAWLARGRAVVHFVRPSVPRLVRATDLHQLPDAPPDLLRSPWCVEVGRPERGERLWGDTWALAGYELDGTHYLIGLEGEGARVVPWRPRWSGRDLAEGVDTTLMDEAAAELGIAASVQGDEAHRAWAVEAARTAVVYALLLDAAGAPVRVTVEQDDRERRRRGSPEPRGTWSTSRVTLTPEGDRAVSVRPDPAGPGEPADLSGRVAVDRPVVGHLKRQRYGEGNRQVRWIYVEGYAARRWVAPWSARDVTAGKA